MKIELKNFVNYKIEQGYTCYKPARSNDDNFNGFSQPLSTDKAAAKIIEGDLNYVSTKKINLNIDKSGFSYFLDGIERKRTLTLLGHIPIIYGYISAVILERKDKKLLSCGLEKTKEVFYLPYKETGDEPDFYFEKNDLMKFNFTPVNIGKKIENKDYPLYPQDFEQVAHGEIQEERRKAEAKVTSDWLKSYNSAGWLYVDGGLSRSTKDLLKSNMIAGVIKSHNTVYFSPEEQFKIYSMKAGERSSIFVPIAKNNKEKEVYSWYLRLHERKNKGDANFGIVRVEIPQSSELVNDVLVDTVDMVSKWILLEKNPVAFPASRWDRMIYPIKYCEDYLKSKSPSYRYIENLI